MANEVVKLSRGLKANLPAASAANAGLLGFTTDTGELYIYDSSTSRISVKDPTKLPLTGGTLSGNLNPNATNTRSLGTSALKWASVYATTFYGSLSGNATTATTASKTTGTLTFTGGATGTFNGSGNVSIAVPAAYTHPNAGTAGTYGPSANLSVTWGSTFTVPYVTTNAQGHITSSGVRTMTMMPKPADNVIQNAAISTNASYPVILGGSTATTSYTGAVNKASTLTYNPSTGVLTCTKVEAIIDDGSID